MDQLVPLRIHGHDYDVRIIGASFEYVALRADLQMKQTAGIDPGLTGLLSLETREVVLSQARDVHELAGSRGDDAVCSCGLIVPAGLPRSHATGHLDQRTWDPATTLVVADNDQPGAWDEIPTDCRARCQDCGWSGPATTVEYAHAHRREHACAAVHG